MRPKALWGALQREWLWRAAFVVAFVIASYFLLVPGDRVPSVAPGVPQFDKVEHVATFAVLGFLGTRAYPRNPAWGIFVGLSFYGAAIEFAQRNIPGRSADVLDWAADTLGALMAFWRTRRRPTPSS